MSFNLTDKIVAFNCCRISAYLKLFYGKYQKTKRIIFSYSIHRLDLIVYETYALDFDEKNES